MFLSTLPPSCLLKAFVHHPWSSWLILSTVLKHITRNEWDENYICYIFEIFEAMDGTFTSLLMLSQSNKHR